MSHLVTQQEARALTAALETTINEVLKRYGFDEARLKTTYGDHYALKITSTPLQEGPGGINLNSPEAQDYIRETNYDPDLSPDALGREFQYAGDTYIFAGFVPRRPKYPFVAIKKNDGRSFKFTHDIKRHLS